MQATAIRIVARGRVVTDRAAGERDAALAIDAAAVLAWLFMDNLAEATADPGSMAGAARSGQTWLMSFLYIGTFGSFIGYSAAFPTLLTNVFDRPDIALAWGFLGALVGSVSRPLGGRLSDRVGGSLVTAGSFVLMTAGALGALYSVTGEHLGLFFASFLALFVATGVGNGSTYRMIPAIFRGAAVERGGSAEDLAVMRRQAAGAIGIAAIVAAFRSPSRVPKPSVRTWQEVANETVEAVTDSMGVGAHAS